MLAGRRTLPSMSRPERIIVALLVASIFVNYIDRANLSIAAPVLEKQLGLSSLQVGSLLSAFFWTYAFLQLFGVAGWVVDRLPVGRVFAWGYFSWCAATIATGCMSGFVALYADSIAAGRGRVHYLSLLFANFCRIPRASPRPGQRPDRRWNQDWPCLRNVYRGISAHPLWLAHDVYCPGRGGAAVAVTVDQAHAPFAPGNFLYRRSRCRPLPNCCASARPGARSWGSSAGTTSYYFLLTWLPIYFVRERNLSLGAMTRLTSAVFLGIACATLTAGWIADHLIGRGLSPTQVRRSIAVGGLLVASSLAAFAFIDNLTGSVVLVMVGQPGSWSLRCQPLGHRPNPCRAHHGRTLGQHSERRRQSGGNRRAFSGGISFSTPEAPCAWHFPGGRRFARRRPDLVFHGAARRARAVGKTSFGGSNPLKAVGAPIRTACFAFRMEKATCPRLRTFTAPRPAAP